MVLNVADRLLHESEGGKARVGVDALEFADHLGPHRQPRVGRGLHQPRDVVGAWLRRLRLGLVRGPQQTDHRSHALKAVATDLFGSVKRHCGRARILQENAPGTDNIQQHDGKAMADDVVNVPCDALAFARGGGELQAVVRVGQRGDQFALPAKDASDAPREQAACGEEDERVASIGPIADSVDDRDDDRAGHDRGDLRSQRPTTGDDPRQSQQAEEDGARRVVDGNHRAGNAHTGNDYQPGPDSHAAG